MAERIIDIGDAKQHLFSLLKSVREGEEIVLTQAGKPCARLVPYSEKAQRELGFVAGKLDEPFFDALPESELSAWET